MDELRRDLIKYVRGDATQPQGEGKKIISHICNDVGAHAFGMFHFLSFINKYVVFI